MISHCANVKALLYVCNRDRIRTTNNMLGDCYAAAVVEQLSKKELMALDAAAYQVRDVDELFA
jgi:Na+/H+-dicarboxylate symporter